MIEAYLSASRRLKPPPSRALLAQYRSMYDSIVANIPRHDDTPELFVTYSSERRCEFIRVAGKEYLVYDQYLGQTFNRLNRIQFAKHGAQSLSRSIACKILAEHLIRLAAPAAATFCGMAAWGYDQNVKSEGGDPFLIPEEDEAVRVNMVAVQEMFVMAHELAHFRYSIDELALKAETSHYVERFLDSKGAPPEADSDGVETASGSDTYYRETLAMNDCIPEMFADDFGALIALRIATENAGIPPSQTIAGIVLAFKYLRLLHHIEVMAYGVAELENMLDAHAFQERLGKLADDVWSKAQGIRVMQLREHFLRYRLNTDARTEPSLKADSKRYDYLIEEYDEKTEFPVTFKMADWLQANLTPTLLSDIKKQPGPQRDPTAAVDFLTGWSKVPPRIT